MLTLPNLKRLATCTSGTNARSRTGNIGLLLSDTRALEEARCLAAQAFPEENAAVQLQLVTAAVKLFLKSPQPRAQQMIQLVLTYATQVHSPPAAL